MGCLQRRPPTAGDLEPERIPAGFQRVFVSSRTVELKIQHETRRGWFREVKQLWQRGPRSARAAQRPPCPGDPTMCPSVVPVGGCLPAERSFQWECSRAQPQGLLDWARGTKGQCFLGSGEVLRLETRRTEAAGAESRHYRGGITGRDLP